MRPLAKITLVGLGYIGALAIAFAAVSLYIACTNSPDRETYAAMFAFGDSLLFLAIFGVAAVLPTGAALFFLRPYRPFWRALSITAVVIATSGVAAFCVLLEMRRTDPNSVASVWPALAVVAPLFALAFLVSALFAPSRLPRSRSSSPRPLRRSSPSTTPSSCFTRLDRSDTRRSKREQGSAAINRPFFGF
jgi:hypothetical protein